MKHLVKIFESYYDDMSELDKVIDRFCDESGLDYVKDINHLIHKLEIDFYDEGFCSYAFDNQNHLLIRCFSHKKIDNDKIEWFIKVLDQIDFLADGKNVYTLGDSDYENSPTTRVTQPSGIKHNVMIRTTVVTTKIWKDLFSHYNNKNTSDRDKTLLEEEMAKLDPNDFIHAMFEFYLRNYHFIQDFSIMSVLKDKYPIIEKPIEINRVYVGHNMATQYAYDMAPLFLKRLYEDAGMLCKFGTPREAGGWDKEPMFRDDLSPRNEIKQLLDSNTVGKVYKVEDVIIISNNYW